MAQEIILVDPLDGSGSGKARIKNGKLESKTISIPNIEDSAENGLVYHSIATHTVALVATLENVVYFKNISKSQKIHINKIMFVSDQVGTEYNIYMNPVFTSGGVLTTPVNMKSDVTTDDSESTILDNSLNDLVLTNTNKLLPVRVSGNMHTVFLNDSLVITPNGSFSVDVKHATLLPVVQIVLMFRREFENGNS